GPGVAGLAVGLPAESVGADHAAGPVAFFSVAAPRDEVAVTLGSDGAQAVAELGPSHEGRGAARPHVAESALADRVTGVRLGEHRAAAFTDRVEGGEDRGGFVIGLESPGREPVQRADDLEIGL